MTPWRSNRTLLLRKDSRSLSRVYHHNAQQLRCHQGQGNPQKHTFMAPKDSCHYLP